jgi:hypothetical protein
MIDIQKLLQTIEKFPPNLDQVIGKKGLFLRKEGEYWIGEVKAQNQAKNTWYNTKSKSLEDLIYQIYNQIEADTVDRFYNS